MYCHPGPSLLSRVGTAAAEVVVQDQEPPNPPPQQMEVNWAERIQPQGGQAFQKFGRLGEIYLNLPIWLPVAIFEALTTTHDIQVDLGMAGLMFFSLPPGRELLVDTNLIRVICRNISRRNRNSRTTVWQRRGALKI